MFTVVPLVVKFQLRCSKGGGKTCWDCVALDHGSSCHSWWDQGRLWLHECKQRPLNHTLSLLVPSHFELQAFLGPVVPSCEVQNPNCPTVNLCSTIWASRKSFMVNFRWLWDFLKVEFSYLRWYLMCLPLLQAPSLHSELVSATIIIAHIHHTQNLVRSNFLPHPRRAWAVVL